MAGVELMEGNHGGSPERKGRGGAVGGRGMGRLRPVHAWFSPDVATFPLVLRAERDEKTAAGMRRRGGKREEKEKEGKEKERKRYGKFFKLENFQKIKDNL
jgi:hypothetical protein